MRSVDRSAEEVQDVISLDNQFSNVSLLSESLYSSGPIGSSLGAHLRFP